MLTFSGNADDDFDVEDSIDGANFSMLMTRRSVMLMTLMMLLMSLMTMLLMLMTKRLVSALASAPPCTASQSAQGRFPGDNNNNDHPDYDDNDDNNGRVIIHYQ